MHVKPSTCALLFALLQPLAAHAELPEAGLSMKAVEARFGQPLRKDAAVGHPPITRWEYSDFVVVFEHSTTVHSMGISRPDGSPAPQPAAPAKTPAPAPAPAKTPAPAPAKAAAPARPAPAPAKPAPAVQPAPAPAQPAPKPVTAPAAKPAAPAPAAKPAAVAPPPAADRQAAEAAAMSKAAAEKSAADDSEPLPPIPGATPAPADGYTFDPETGRIIVK